MNRAFKLFRLQQVDTQVDELQARLAEIDKLLTEDQVVKEAREAVATNLAQRDTVQKDLHRAEEDVKAQQIKIDHNQASLYGGKITNPKELQDLQAEAEALKRHFSALEDVQLEKLMAYEEKQAAMTEAEAQLEAILAQRSVEQSTLSTEQSDLQGEVSRLEGERVSAETGVSPEDVQTYEALRKSKGGKAIAKVENKSCSACGTELSNALAQASRSPNELARCANCKRILYAG
jgi:predicted  nucleic acid-binding Zn-ribbon protein